MPTDLQIIEQIEKAIGKKLEHLYFNFFVL